MKKTAYESIYKKLNLLIPCLSELEMDDAQSSKADGFMDLNLDILQIEQNFTIIALSHYYQMNGDNVADPDMEIKVYPKHKMAEALTYQDGFGYQRVYPEKGKVNIKARGEQNSFLNQWLKNCLDQGHKFSTKSHTNGSAQD